MAVEISLTNSPLGGFSKELHPFEPRRRNFFVWHVLDAELQVKQMFYARVVNIPQVDIPSVEDHFITARWYVHGGKWEFSEITVEFMFHYQKNPGQEDIYDVFWGWLRKAVDWYSPFAAGFSEKYVSTGFIVLLRPDLTVDKIYQLVRCWPRQIGNIELSYDSGEILRIPVIFRFDRVFCFNKKSS